MRSAQTDGFIRKRLRQGREGVGVHRGNAANGVGGLSVKLGGLWRDLRSNSLRPLHVQVIGAVTRAEPFLRSIV